jgi:hypothetical protein
VRCRIRAVARYCMHWYITIYFNLTLRYLSYLCCMLLDRSTWEVSLLLAENTSIDVHQLMCSQQGFALGNHHPCSGHACERVRTG